ncbi:MAG TPA: DUF5658 family protein [Fimbriimonadales bacterium]|nr:DUF5658 family protein [Fimbriimonadales bacterium]
MHEETNAVVELQVEEPTVNKNWWRGRVRLSTLCLVTVILFDLVTTLFLLNQGFGEANPIFANLAKKGEWALVSGKLMFTIIPLLILEWARTKRPFTAEIGTWTAFIAYTWLYVLNLLRYY